MPPLDPQEDQPIDKQPQDDQSSFQPTDPNDDGTNTIADLPADHPATDASMDEQELYDEGISGAAEAEDPERTTRLDDEAL